MEAITALAEIDVAETSSYLFHTIMQAPTSSALPYHWKRRASCLALYCAYQWEDALPQVEDPQDIFTFLGDHFTSKPIGGHRVHGDFVGAALVALVHAYDSTPTEVHKYINSSPFLNGISDLFHNDKPLSLRRAALLSLSLVGDEEFKAMGWSRDGQTRKRFFGDWASTVNNLDHTPNIWKAILVVLLRMVNSKHWFFLISSENLRFLGRTPSTSNASHSLRSCLDQTGLMDKLRSLGDLAVTANWLIILWLNLQDLGLEVRTELEAITTEFAQDRNEEYNHCVSVMGSRLEEAEDTLASWWSYDPVADHAHQEIIYNLQLALALMQ